MERFEALKTRCDRLVGQKEAVVTELKAVQTEVVELTDQRDLLSKCVEVMKQVVEKATERDLRQIEQFGSMALHKVIHDQVINCQVRPHETAGASKIIITGHKATAKGDIEGPFTESFGGGSWNVVSVMLRIMTILRMKQRRRLFLDQSFGDLHVSYLDAMGDLMTALVRKLAFKCLLVTHQAKLAERADRIYRASLVNGDELTLDRAK
jgi:hypothetical protein